MGGIDWDQTKKTKTPTHTPIFLLPNPPTNQPTNQSTNHQEFGFGQEERDRLLGAELSLAYSVFSIPGVRSIL